MSIDPIIELVHPEVKAKLVRAAYHMVTLEHAVEQWLADHTRVQSTVSDDRRTIEIGLLINGEAPTTDWGAMFGDAIHNLRSSLDVWMWYAVLDQAKGPVEPNEVYFPITTDGKGFRNWKSRTGKYVTNETVESVRKAQPYMYPLKPGFTPQQQGLAVLHALDLADKHRIINKLVIGSQYEGGGFSFHTDVVNKLTGSFESPIDISSHGGIMSRYQFEHPVRDVEFGSELKTTACFVTDTVPDPVDVFWAINGFYRCVVYALKQASGV